MHKNKAYRKENGSFVHVSPPKVVNMMPNWIPGRKNDKPVRCYFNLPVMFRLN